MSRIFVSYARTDGAEIADELSNRLRARGHDVFLDVHSIRAGTQWRSELSRFIKRADLVLVLVTPGSNESDYVYLETEQAKRHGKIVMPVQVDGTPLPRDLRGLWQAISLEGNNFDAILLEIESSLRRSRIIVSPLLIGGIVAAMLVLGFGMVLVIAMLGQKDDKDPPASIKSDTATPVAVRSSATPTEIDAESEAVLPNTPTLTPTRTPTRTPVPTPTLSPDKRAATAIAPLLDRMQLVYGPENGQLEEHSGVCMWGSSPDISLRDFVAVAQFSGDVSQGAWWRGFFFRDNGNDIPHYRLLVRSSGDWMLVLWRGDYFTLAEGRVNNINSLPGSVNTLQVIAYDNDAWFYINGEYVTTLDVSDHRDRGSVKVATCFTGDSRTDGRVSPYSNFEIYSIP